MTADGGLLVVDVAGVMLFTASDKALDANDAEENSPGFAVATRVALVFIDDKMVDRDLLVPSCRLEEFALFAFAFIVVILKPDEFVIAVGVTPLICVIFVLLVF